MAAFGSTTETAEYFNVPQPDDAERGARATKRRNKINMRMRSLKREIQVAKSRKREYDHLSAELRDCEFEMAEILKEALEV